MLGKYYSTLFKPFRQSNHSSQEKRWKLVVLHRLTHYKSSYNIKQISYTNFRWASRSTPWNFHILKARPYVRVSLVKDGKWYSQDNFTNTSRTIWIQSHDIWLIYCTNYISISHESYLSWFFTKICTSSLMITLYIT